MTEGRFYSVLLIVFGSVTMFCVTWANIAQPERVDVELTTRLLTFAGIIVGPIILILNSNKNSAKVEHKVDVAADKAEAAAEKADTAAHTVSNLPEMVATKLREDGITSSFAPPKDQEQPETRFKR